MASKAPVSVSLVPTSTGQHTGTVLPMGDPGTEIQHAFVAFFAAILPGALQRRAADEAAVEIANALRLYFRPDYAGTQFDEDYLLAGSLPRRSAIRPLRGSHEPIIDLFYILPDGSGPTAALECLSETGRALRIAGFDDAHPICSVPAVRLRFGPLTVDVRPARTMGDGLTIPGLGDEPFPVWIRSDPHAEAAALRTLSHAYRERPRMLIALIKAWRDQAAAPLSGYAVETMVRAFYRDVNRPDDGNGDPGLLFETFMAWARNVTPGVFPLPGSGQVLEVDSQWHPHAESAYWRAVRARGLAREGDVGRASQEWRVILGRRFPRLADVVTDASLPVRARTRARKRSCA